VGLVEDWPISGSGSIPVDKSPNLLDPITCWVEATAAEPLAPRQRNGGSGDPDVYGRGVLVFLIR
jgi:hypothetical protein